MKNLIPNFDFASHFRQNMSAMIFSFLVGTGISTIPFAINLIENIRNDRVVLIKNELKMESIKSICKNSNSKYTKLLNLGFSESALISYESCISKHNLNKSVKILP